MSERRLVALRQITDDHFVLVGRMLNVKITKEPPHMPQTIGNIK